MTHAEEWPRLRAAALESLRLLVSLMEAESSQPRLVEGYLEAKRLLADAFQALLRERIQARVGLLASIKEEIENEMKSALSGKVPEKYLHVRGYNSPHRELFAYLSLFVGKAVPASALRILTADAVHTERRARELRDLGLELEATRTGGADVYVLHSTDPDLKAAAEFLVRHNISGDRDLDPRMRAELLAHLSA